MHRFSKFIFEDDPPSADEISPPPDSRDQKFSNGESASKLSGFQSLRSKVYNLKFLGGYSCVYLAGTR